jgi:AcrR family transcriptional regulator
VTGPRRRNADTRGEILDTAMRLFAEQGYDKTSLREIAEAVGVTKAALYYHFRTKEDIAGSALQDYTRDLTALIDRAAEASPGAERNTALVDGLLELFTTTGGAALRFGQANPTVMSQLHIGEAHVTQLKRLVGILAGDGAPAENTIRATLAFGALIIGVIGGELELAGPAAEQASAARRVALDLLAPLG